MKSEFLKLKEIEILFENCEYCIIPANQIKELVLNQYKSSLTSFDLNKGNFSNNTLEKLRINNRYLKTHYSMFTKDCINKDKPLIKRLKDQDIVSISLTFYKDVKSKEYYFIWNDDNEYINKYQHFKTGIFTSTLKIVKEEN